MPNPLWDQLEEHTQAVMEELNALRDYCDTLPDTPEKRALSQHIALLSFHGGALAGMCAKLIPEQK